KAGNGTAEAQERADEVAEFMNYIKNLGVAGNYFFMGDFNLYDDDEDAFQQLINPTNATYKFYDPVNQIGNWHVNSTYKNYHTQSTHTEYNGCASTGGMDDRFDFIMASGNIINGTDKVQYIADSYTTLGQDGSSYNSALNTTSNSSVPTAVAQALYNNSDHLPVMLDIKIDKDLGNVSEITDVYHTPENPYSNQDVTVTAEVVDNNDTINQLILKWGNSSNNYSDTIVMTPTGNSYNAVFYDLTAGTEIFYKVEALDNQEDIVDSSEERSFAVTDFGFDNITYTPEYPDSSNNVTISCEFNDPQGLMFSLKVLWGKHADELYTGELMSENAGVYEALIPAQNTADTVYFELIAKDIKSDTIANSDLFYYVVGEDETGINSINNYGKIKFPNPVNNSLELSLESLNFGEYNLELISLSGEKLFSEKININSKSYRKSINLNFLEKGIYILNIRKNPNFNVSKKIIKE
ncbi:MAG: T9SS type A sorting domain-containing protein, partial [Bacteroidota bacterium]|nr:T9SS type A sorting domain-containing protein [Bacteroidota bacterium]